VLELPVAAALSYKYLTVLRQSLQQVPNLDGRANVSQTLGFVKDGSVVRSGSRGPMRVAAPHLSLAGSQEVSQLPQADSIHEIEGVQSPAPARRMEPRFW